MLHELFVKIELAPRPTRFKFETAGSPREAMPVDTDRRMFELVPYLRCGALDGDLAVRRAELRLDEKLITEGLPL